MSKIEPIECWCLIIGERVWECSNSRLTVFTERERVEQIYTEADAQPFMLVPREEWDRVKLLSQATHNFEPAENTVCMSRDRWRRMEAEIERLRDDRDFYRREFNLLVKEDIERSGES